MNIIPDIEIYDNINPTIYSQNSPYEISFQQTKQSLIENVEDYSNFLHNIITRFRKSRTYKKYKGYLIDLGLDRCQFHGNITNNMATIEMHHNMLTLFDIALILTEYMLNVHKYVTTYDIIYLLKEEHKNNRVQLTMLSLTPHQLYHNDDDFYIDPKMCFGKWWEFIELYKEGITIDIAYKIIRILDTSIKRDGNSDDNNLLELRKKIIDWSQYNELVYNKTMY